MNDLQKEWAILHTDIEKYERFSLLIKLVSVLVSVIGVMYFANGLLTTLFIFILWLQDAIWKTFQKRLENRILLIEQALHDEKGTKDSAFQFYSQWQDNRLGVVGLVKEYLSNAAKPTVAYPYILLVTIILFIWLFTTN